MLLVVVGIVAAVRVEARLALKLQVVLLLHRVYLYNYTVFFECQDTSSIDNKNAWLRIKKKCIWG